MITQAIEPGMRAYWSHHCTSRHADRYLDVVLVLQVHPHTAKISIRRRDGRFKQRWVKLARLTPAH